VLPGLVSASVYFPADLELVGQAWTAHKAQQEWWQLATDEDLVPHLNPNETPSQVN